MNPIIDGVTTLDYRTRFILDYIQHTGAHIGEYKWSCRSNDYNGWMVCDGRSVSCVDYSNLYDIIGTAFGCDSEGTFNLPNFKGRVMAGTSCHHDLGEAVGCETVTLTVDQMPAHTHTGTTGASGEHSHSITDPGHAHTQTTINDDFNGSGGNPPGFISDSTGSRTWNNINSSTTGISVNQGGSHTHYFTTNSTGGGEAHNNMQPTVFAGHVFIFGGWRDLSADVVG